ncbi:hypothetical protein [Bowdeniella massiliensis]|uniref:hypothetical protein n=1 Tax=Bowdeniella massiliensis TaxID=2932264 RepID=UPI002028A6AB|nr:hypothetical protein [Bowdeniella massiliensis]
MLPTLIRCWVLLHAHAGKFTAPFMPVLVPLLRTEVEIQVTDEQAELLGGRSRTKPGSLAQAPDPDAHFRRLVRGGARVHQDRPGRPGRRRGGRGVLLHPDHDRYRNTLVGQPVNAQPSQGLGDRGDRPDRGDVPFPIRGIDSDNGSEFINHLLLTYCEQCEITYTRGRSGKKNDGCYL